MGKVVILAIGMVWIFAGVKSFVDHSVFLGALEYTVGSVFIFIGIGGK